MANVPPSFVKETLWPEFEKFNETLRAYLDDITERVISEGIYKDNTEADVIDDNLLGKDLG